MTFSFKIERQRQDLGGNFKSKDNPWRIMSYLIITIIAARSRELDIQMEELF
jgi:hypothetical protein